MNVNLLQLDPPSFFFAYHIFPLILKVLSLVFTAILRNDAVSKAHPLPSPPPSPPPSPLPPPIIKLYLASSLESK